MGLQCSEDCGTGVQTRKVHCSGPGIDSCDVRSKPDESRACSSDKQCSGKWFTGPWGQVIYSTFLALSLDHPVCDPFYGVCFMCKELYTFQK